MKRLIILAAASSALATPAFMAPALAADVIYNEPAPAPMVLAPIESTKNWTGIYIGGQAGGAFSNSGNGASFDPGNNGVFGNGTFRDDEDNAGFVGGGHIGYDYQFQNDVVVGAVADINYIDGETNRRYKTAAGSTFETNSEINYLGTVRGRLGYAFDSLLVYGSGGLAYAGTDNKSRVDGASNGEFAGYKFDKNNDDTDVGYSVGGGVDVLATQNISFGVEYLYTNLGSNDQTITGRNGNNKVSFTSESDNDDLDFHTVWAKASYRFH